MITGPEIRTGILPGNKDEMELVEGSTLIVTRDSVVNDPPPSEETPLRLSIDYDRIAHTVKVHP